MTVTRSGARLSTRQHGFTFRGLAQISPSDLEQKKCASCGGPISDDRAYVKTEELTLYCSRRCKGTAFSRRRGVPVGRATKWRALYELAKAHKGEWVHVPVSDQATAKNAAHSANQRRDFEASSIGQVVSIRFVVAS